MNDSSPRHGDYGHNCWGGCVAWRRRLESCFEFRVEMEYAELDWWSAHGQDRGNLNYDVDYERMSLVIAVHISEWQ